MPYNNDIVKEVTMLRGLVRSLEEELSESHLNYQKELRKKNQINQKLLSQIEKLKCHEQFLITQVRNLTLQLTACKKNLSSSTKQKTHDSSFELPPKVWKSHSRDYLKKSNILSDNDCSSFKIMSEFEFWRNKSKKGSGRIRDFIPSRSSSLDRNSFFDRLSRPRVRMIRSESADYFNRNARSNRSNSSKNNSYSFCDKKIRPPNVFDPTAYIIERRKKLQENKDKMQKIIQNRMSGRTPSPRKTSISYSDDSLVETFESESEINFKPRKSRFSGNIYQSEDENTIKELAQIDVRLHRLKQYMKDNINSE